MSTQASKTKTFMTAEELFEMPDDDYRYELIKGELIKMSPVGGRHAEITVNLSILLGSYVKSRRLGIVCAGEPGFILARNPDTVRAPDAAFVSQERISKEGEPTGFATFAPDLARVRGIKSRMGASPAPTKTKKIEKIDYLPNEPFNLGSR